ncbi:hypothetical protein ACKKBG_A23215 [Auxenochlorella protothecoides x Auxenochlorella symbiontica]
MSPHFASSKSQQTRVKEPPAWKDEVPAKLHLTLAPSLASSEGTPGSQEGALGHCLETPDESSAGQGGSLERHSPPPQVSAFASAAVQSGVRGTDRPPAAPARAATASPLGSLSEADALHLSVLLAHARLQIQKEAQQGLASRSPSSGSEASPAADIHPLLMQGLTALCMGSQGSGGAAVPPPPPASLPSVRSLGQMHGAPAPAGPRPPMGNTITSGVPGMRGPVGFQRSASVPGHVGGAADLGSRAAACGSAAATQPLPRITVAGRALVLPPGGTGLGRAASGVAGAPAGPPLPSGFQGTPAGPAPGPARPLASPSSWSGAAPHATPAAPHLERPSRSPAPRHAAEARAARREAPSPPSSDAPVDESEAAAELLLGIRTLVERPARAHSAPLLAATPGLAGRGGAAKRAQRASPAPRVDRAPGSASGEDDLGPGLWFPASCKRLRSGGAAGGPTGSRRPAGGARPASAGSWASEEDALPGGAAVRGAAERRAAAGSGELGEEGVALPEGAQRSASLTALGGAGRAPRLPGPQGPTPARAAPGQTRAELARARRAPLEKVERPITNGTYINRLHVTQQMAQLLFPQPEEARERGRAPGREGDAPANFNSLFKHRLVIVDEADEAWPVQYEGFMSSGQRHFRLTSGWSGLMRVQNVTIGDTLALERWTEDRTVIHLRIIRRQGREGEALPRPPA